MSTYLSIPVFKMGKAKSDRKGEIGYWTCRADNLDTSFSLTELVDRKIADIEGLNTIINELDMTLIHILLKNRGESVFSGKHGTCPESSNEPLQIKITKSYTNIFSGNSFFRTFP